MAKRKRLTMIVKVSVPANMPAAQARLEVKTAVNHFSAYRAEEGDVKALSIKPAHRNSAT